MKAPRRYLVTGAGGFLGRHFLTALIERGAQVRAMVRRPPHPPLPSRVEQVVADLGSADSLAAAVEGVTDIVHLAGRAHRMEDTAEDPLAAFREVNVEGTRRLAEAAASAGACRFVLASSVKAMGEEASGAFDETSPCAPSTPYGVSKLEAERVLLDLSGRHGLHAVVLRLPMVYGPGNKGNVLLLLEAAAAGRRLPFGSLKNRRSMVYVDNLVQAALLALDSERSRDQVYLVADARSYSSRDLYAAICRAMGKQPLLFGIPPGVLRLLGNLGGWGETLLRRPLPINPEVVARLTGDLLFDTRKIRAQLGFEPAVDLEEGMERTVEWYLGRTLAAEERDS